MVSYMLSNTHIIDQFLGKDEIEIEDIFSDVCEILHISHQTLPGVEPKVELDIGLKPILSRTTRIAHRYSIDGSTLRFAPPDRVSTTGSISTNYQLVTKLFITTWIDSLIWINPLLQHNCVGPDLFPQIQEHKAQYVSILLDSTEHIVHIESGPLPKKADLVLGLRFLSDLRYTTTDHALSIKINGRVIQAIRTHD